MIAALNGARQALFHLRAIVAVKAVTFHESGLYVLPPEYLLEGTHDRSRFRRPRSR